MNQKIGHFRVKIVGDSAVGRGVKSGSFLQRYLLIANYHVKKFVRNSQ